MGSSSGDGARRVLVVSAPMLGHAFPLMPLALALRAAGHQVLVATAGDGLAVRDAGLPVEDVAPQFDFARIARCVMLRHPLIARAELAGTGGTRGVGLLFGAVNEQIADAVVAVARRWRPDLVVHEPLAVAGALAAAAVGVPAVLHENSLFDGPTLIGATADRLDAARRRHGVAALPPPAATISIAPPSVRGGRSGWPMRAVPYQGKGRAPDWLCRPAERPRIVVSRSTVVGPGGGRLMPAVVTAAGAMDAEFVLVRPDRRSAAMALPPNVRTVDWVPLSTVLPHCAGAVHHGGAGTALAALHAGVPQLVVTGPGDRRHNAGLVAARGAGLAVAERQIDAAVLTRLLRDVELARNAAAVRDEMAAMPAPEELVPRLVALAPPR
jgi:UDP:flavonoid glycosyltransferase YjiC (YdhE family)